VIVSAALAVAERQKASGERFLEALATGYEVALRLAAACRPSPAQHDLVHGPSSVLAMGAAVAAGRVLGLDADGLARAMGIAGPLSPIPGGAKLGLDESQIAWIKDNVSWAAEAGVRAALLAAAGFPASRTYLDGQRGFWRMIGSDRFDPALLADPATVHLRALAFKPYPCARWLHAALDATALIMTSERGREVGDIVWIRVESTRPVAAASGNRRPRTMVDAQFSAPHAVAALALHIPLVDWWRENSRGSPLVLELMDRIELASSPELTDAFLRDGQDMNRVPARVTIRLRDGREASASSDHPMGTPGRVNAQLRETDHFAAKHRALFGLILNQPGIDALGTALMTLPSAPFLDGIVRLLAPAPSRRS
jgi:2-methylcitrate dehydratase PrpD